MRRDLGRRQALEPEGHDQRPAVLRRLRRQRAALQRHGRHPGQRLPGSDRRRTGTATASSPPTGATCRRATRSTSSATGGTPNTSILRASSAARAARTSRPGETISLAKRTSSEELAKGAPAQRYQWNAPIVLSPHNPGIVYICSQFVHRSLSHGDRDTFVTDQPRPDPGRQDAARGGQEDQPPVRHGLRLRRVAQEARPLLGGHRRRQPPDVARRRRHLDQHHGAVLRHEDRQAQGGPQGRPHPVRPLGQERRSLGASTRTPATWASAATGPTTRTRPGSSSPTISARPGRTSRAA